MISIYNYQIASAMGVGDREHQEDALKTSALTEVPEAKGFLTVLSDGMGGLAEGEKFSALATDKMTELFMNLPATENPSDELLYCYEETQKLAILSQPADEVMRGGATVTAVLFRDGKCTCLSVGDSRIYLKRGKGLIQLNREQNLGVRLDERAALGILTWNQAKNNVNRSSLIAHLGRDSGIEPDINRRPIDLVDGDMILQMSDGVFGTLNDREMLECLLEADDIQKAADSIIKKVIAKKKPHQDNCSILITQITDAMKKE